MTSLPPNLKEMFDRLVRGGPTDMDAYLTNIETALPVSDTKLSVHCHAVGLDGQQLPRVKDLAKFLALKIMDYAIPRPEIERAKKHYDATGSSSKFAELDRKAANLFSDLEKSGEGGELLLYLLVEYFLKLPQVICKMPLKTNARMHYHGIDGIHASVNEVDGGLALYWGESKLYQNANEAIEACINSIRPFLEPGGGSGDPRERDLQIMRDNIALNNPDLEQALLKYLNPDDPMYKHLHYRGVCLIGFDHTSYPNTPHSKTEAAVCAEIKSSIATWLEKLKTTTLEASLDSFTLEVFFVPFPSVKEFRDAFAREINVGVAPRTTS